MSEQRNLFTFDTYMAATDQFAIYQDPMYPYLALAEETGEVLGKVAKSVRGDKPLDDAALRKEVGDVLWNVARICRDKGWSMGHVALDNLSKLHDRQQRNVLKGDGDHR